MSLTQRYERHEYSKMFPDMPRDEFKDLVRDIKRNGLRLKIVAHENKIIEGWHRYLACLEAGVRPLFELMPEGVDPYKYALSMNLYRRHLSAAQRAAILVKQVNLRKPGNPQLSENCLIETDADDNEMSVAEAAELAGTSESYVKDALKAKRENRIDAIIKGDEPLVPKKPKSQWKSKTKRTLEKWQQRNEDLQAENADLKEQNRQLKRELREQAGVTLSYQEATKAKDQQEFSAKQIQLREQFDALDAEHTRTLAREQEHLNRIAELEAEVETLRRKLDVHGIYVKDNGRTAVARNEEEPAKQEDEEPSFYTGDYMK